jgi:ADP-heptose:LPS heptosyltransferase
MKFKPIYKNILIVRTDRIGDVVLTTPVISALRKAYPKARLSIMVRNDTRDVVDGNPYLDQVVVYDRDPPSPGL